VSTRRKLGIVLVGAVLVLLLFAAFWLLTSSGSFPGGLDPRSRSASPSPERAEAPTPSASESSAPAPPSPFAAATPETAAISVEPPLADSIPSTRTGPEDSSRAAGSEPAPPPRSLLIPVAGVRPEELVDTYTAARSEGRSHDAIDIAAARGTPVLAAAEGTVLKLFDSEQGGITLYQLDPDQRTIYYYAHLDRYAPAIAEGMLLRQGDTIGYVGDTGNAGAGNYHLHFGISTTHDPTQYWGGTLTNPYPLLRGMRTPRQ
jgi:murein DD-endopeptidase MepM/ murein hydrolase activator NlpD